MPNAFLFLCLQTILLWLLVTVLYKLKNRYTLVPFYAFLAVFTFLAQNLNDLGFFVSSFGLTFWIGSFSFFTASIFSVLIMYLFEGPRAARTGLWVIISTTLFYAGLVFLIGQQLTSSNWVEPSLSVIVNSLWSIFAITVNIMILGLGWELMSKIKKLPLVLRVFIMISIVMVMDTIIYTTGAFGYRSNYLSILETNILTRFILALISAPIMTTFLKFSGFSEDRRSKPTHFWEILNFKTDLELKIVDLESTINTSRELENALTAAKDTYELIIGGSGAGFWEIDVNKNKITYSPHFLSMLGYDKNDLGEKVEDFVNLIHPTEKNNALAQIKNSLTHGDKISIEYRLRHKNGEYRWYQVSGATKLDQNHKPIKSAGTIIDIDDRKNAELKVLEQLDELTRLNKIMVDRELKMSELKAELRKNQSN